MIFLLRLIIFSFLIILGFHLSLRSKKGRSTDGSEHLSDDLYMIVLALFSVGVLWIQGVQLVFVHLLDDSAVCGGADHDVVVFYICCIFYIDHISVMVDRFHAVTASQLRCGTVFWGGFPTVDNMTFPVSKDSPLSDAIMDRISYDSYKIAIKS